MTNVTSLGGPSPLTSRPVAAPETTRVAQPLDRGKLDALRSAIQAGRYPLDAAKLAERMVAMNAVQPK